ncbi:hypothetical protein FB567DRAFT_543430 [Paraphoma chrysanthemicola]|uniref:Uncharacterized protein n=1 Tax=Paraphoma chrysanthemicola TaxID=798071 RepID=A0A8K0RGS7_9PLEO|nr:hypothetical protein FB567DRAFT_543430 [Paraphoma chrysanthemicola]
MPLTPFLTGPSSPCRYLWAATRLKWLAQNTISHHRPRVSACTKRPFHRPSCSYQTAQRVPGAAPLLEGVDLDSTASGGDTVYPETDLDIFRSNVLDKEVADSASDLPKTHHADDQFRPAHGSRARKRRRVSRPSYVLASIKSSVRDLYTNPSAGNTDLSYREPRPFVNGPSHPRARADFGTTYSEPLSLYSILARYLDHHTGLHAQDMEFEYSIAERNLLKREHFTTSSVEAWAKCIVEPKSHVAASVFQPDNEAPPWFLLLLFLRRRHMTAFAFGVVLRHIGCRAKAQPLVWGTLKLLMVRLLRHARELWPESITWIASFFARESNALFGNERREPLPPRLNMDLTRFSNSLLHLLSLPTSTNPILSALHQEKAQFRILQFMARCDPAIVVSKIGFRAIARNQLAHPKTPSEREWAELKGPSWPPWKEDRTAMDEDKDYHFGASRASKILHRMYEAGYMGQSWEEMVELYAGWDTDSSPTIQTRTSLPQDSSHARNGKGLANLVWAARVRTTRTRREAWACFLAYEASQMTVSQQVYLAMFEKLVYPESKRQLRPKAQDDLDEEMKLEERSDESKDDLLPGDMKESVSDSVSPLHQVYISEPVPTVNELYHRMGAHNIQPSGRLLAFLLETEPSFERFIEILESTKEQYEGAIGHLLSGQHGKDSAVVGLPDFLLTAFIKSICRFGRFARTPQKHSDFLPLALHARKFRRDRQYLLEYGYALLSHYKPHYRPAWISYLDKVVRSTSSTEIYPEHKTAVKGRGVTQYVVAWKILDLMEEVDLDVDDEIFNLVCMVTIYAAQAANRGDTSGPGARHIFLNGSPRLRKLFHGLVGANLDMQAPPPDNENIENIPPQVPGPAALHAYVRALGTLHDYEGLYSFSSWLVKHHEAVTARSEAQHSGAKLLFRMLVAIRVALEGRLHGEAIIVQRAPDELVQLIKAQVGSVEEWGGWPDADMVELYVKGGLKSQGIPGVGGR